MIEMNKPLPPMVLCDIALTMLADCYAELPPMTNVKDFHVELMRIVERYDNPTVVKPVEIVMQFLSDDLRAQGIDWVARYPHGPVLISAAYCVRARISFDKGLKELAWSNTAQAMFWCSVANSHKKIDAIFQEAIKDARAEGEAQANSNKARSGAEKRSNGYEPLREVARQFVRRPDKKWSSRSQAGKAVLRELEKFCQQQTQVGEAQMTVPTLETVDVWLKAMPDSGTLFPVKRKSK